MISEVEIFVRPQNLIFVFYVVFCRHRLSACVMGERSSINTRFFTPLVSVKLEAPAKDKCLGCTAVFTHKCLTGRLFFLKIRLKSEMQCERVRKQGNKRYLVILSLQTNKRL